VVKICDDNLVSRFHVSCRARDSEKFNVVMLAPKAISSPDFAP